MPRAAMTAFFIGLVTGTLVDAASAAANESFFVWHITDVHVDPWYTVGSDAKSCYCETTAACHGTDSMLGDGERGCSLTSTTTSLICQ